NRTTWTNPHVVQTMRSEGETMDPNEELHRRIFGKVAESLGMKATRPELLTYGERQTVLHEMARRRAATVPDYRSLVREWRPNGDIATHRDGYMINFEKAAQ